MKLSIFVTLIALTCGAAAQAGVVCKSNNAVYLTADVKSSSDIVLTSLAGEQKGTLEIQADASYRPAKYKGYNRFSTSMGEQNYDILLPADLTDYQDDGAFTGYAIVSNYDGGGTIRLSCSLN